MSASFLKKLAAVTGLLIALWVVYLYRQVPHQGTPFARAVESAQTIRFDQGTQKVQLSRQGGTWKVLLPGGGVRPADETKMKTLLSSLKGLQLEEEISNRADRFSEFQVDDASGTRISLQDAKGQALADGIFGKQAPDFAHSYFRFPNQPQVYLARGVLPGDLGKVEPNYWRSRQLLNIGEAKIQGVVIDGKGFKTTLVRTSTDTWTMNGEAVASPPVDTLVGTLAHLRVDDFVDRSAYPGLSFESLTYAKVSVKGADGVTDIRIGPSDPKTKRYLLSTGKDAGMAWLSEAATKAILLKPSAFKWKQ